MSTVVETLPTLKDNNVLSPNVKMGSKENLSFGLRENTDIVKDLSKEISKKEGHIQDVSTQVKDIQLSVDPKCTSNKQLEKLVEADESLSNDEKQLQIPKSIGNDLCTSWGDGKTPQVQILSLSVISPGRNDIVLPIPFPSTTSKATLFSLKEGSKYRIKFHLTVSGSTIHNLKYTYMVWKSGLRVHQTKKAVGTFTPREEPYVYELEEGTTPTGFFARGPFFVKSKFVDDDGNCYLDTTYYFDIRKDWGARDKS